MKSKIQLATVPGAILAGVLLFSLASLAEDSRIQYTRDPVPRDYTPDYLAARLGVAERSTKLIGLPVRDQAGHKLGKLYDLVVDLNNSRILCVLVGSSDSANPAIVPAKCFHAPGTSGAMLELTKTSLSDVPHSAANAEPAAFLNSLRQSYAFFNQKDWMDEPNSPAQLVKAGEMVGLSIKNKVGEPLGKVVELMADLPTARLVFAVVSFGGKGDDLYTVPPSALRMVAGEHALLLDADQKKVALLAHSDNFFWSGLADPASGAATYRNFGVVPDFDVTSASATGATKEAVREQIQSTPAVQKTDAELQRDMLMALMHDDVNNPNIYKNIRMVALNGQVTLTGKVKNDKLKTKLVTIVAGVVGSANVHDQTEIK